MSQPINRRAWRRFTPAPIGIRSGYKQLVRGFTLIELIFVVVIIGVLIGASAPQLKKALDDFELRNFAKDIYALSLYLQASAVSRATVYCLHIRQEDGEFRASYKAGDGFRDLPGRYGRAYRAPPQTTIALDPPDMAAVYFYPDGGIDRITITLANGQGKQYSLEMRGASGEIKIR